jgi:hypothetical protein
MTPATYTREQLQALFGYADQRSFRARLDGLIAAGFPRPLPGLGRRRLWSRAQVDAWFSIGGRSAHDSGVSDLDAERRRRAARLAAARARQA